MSIAKASVLTFVNNRLKRAETNIDVEIQTILDDLSEDNFLMATDTGQTLSAGDTTLNHPSLMKEEISIVLINSSSVRGAPLEKLSGGHRQYRRLRDNDSATGEPEWYSDFDSKFWLWRPANGTYTTEIEHYKYHAQTGENTGANNIEFSDQYRNAINFGVAAEVACKYGLSRYMDIWGPRYEAAKERRRLNMPQRAYITR